ncbi:MAG: aminotransferase class IV [Saprospiraceae bacterium]|nr:aminotransferase class IV [Saprospiraceae bacterium]
MLQKFDKRNEDINIWVGDSLVHRDEARVSVFDSVVQGGDAVWEGLRLYKEGLFLFDRHLDRLFESAHALAFEGLPSRSFVTTAIFETLKSNTMVEDVHIRLTLTRGEKVTSGMDPRLNQSGTNLIVLPEWKPPVYDNEKGISVITSSVIRNSPQYLDSRIHHNNLLNNILAKIQANVAGADSALMLDKNGFAAELNGTNIFMVRDETVFTPHATACLPGITRGLIIELCEKGEIPIREKDISLTELYNADEVFCTGTMGELTPVTSIDGRKTMSEDYQMLNRLRKAFLECRAEYCTPIV